MKEKIFTLKMNGYCCSQIVAQLGAEMLGRQEDGLVEAAAGLCDGAKYGGVCGAASAALCILYLADAKAAEDCLAQEYLEWFEDSFGSLECRELIAEGPAAKIEKCPLFAENTLIKLEELLELD